MIHGSAVDTLQPALRWTAFPATSIARDSILWP
jgi:hypothetical protein